MNPYEMGFEDGYNGLDYDNPFEFHTSDYTDYDDGYFDGAMDREDNDE
jgi:hypothetical protein